jgi:hypothetical protein
MQRQQNVYAETVRGVYSSKTQQQRLEFLAACSREKYLQHQEKGEIYAATGSCIYQQEVYCICQQEV